MNFYKHHLGDYDGHTAHLSWDEDMAYTRLLRAYYRREKGIPDSEKYRLARAATKSQRGAVDSVLAEFFVRQGDDWRQKRCDEEIEAYQAQAETNRRIARERTVGRTVNEPPTKHIPSQNQIPEPEKSKALSGKPDLRPLAVEILNFLNAKAGKAFRPVDQTLKPIIARLRDGYSPDDIRAVVVAKCREWLPDPKMAYCVRPKTLFGAENFANYEGQLQQVSDGN